MAKLGEKLAAAEKRAQAAEGEAGVLRADLRAKDDEWQEMHGRWAAAPPLPAVQHGPSAATIFRQLSQSLLVCPHFLGNFQL